MMPIINDTSCSNSTMNLKEFVYGCRRSKANLIPSVPRFETRNKNALGCSSAQEKVIRACETTGFSI